MPLVRERGPYTLKKRMLVMFILYTLAQYMAYSSPKYFVTA